mgnify:CR=1 FL=1
MRRSIVVTKSIVLILSHVNWYEVGPGDWEETRWIIYDDYSVNKIEFYYNVKHEQEIKYKRTHRIRNGTFKKLIKFIENAMFVNKTVECCDGTVWEFKYYKNSELVWKRDMGYIDEITELIKIVKIFERYWM